MTRRRREFAVTARKLQREREAAAAIDAHLRDTPPRQWIALAARREMRTCGALERLGNIVAEVVGDDPERAHAVAELAVAIALAMPHDAYPPPVVAQLRGHAWKDLGKSLLELKRFEDALTALDRAEEAIADCAPLAHDRAIVGIVRAAALQEVGRADDAFAVLAECKDVFRDHGDEKRLLLCGIAEGVLLQRLRKYREAREAYLLLLAGHSLDPDATASLHRLIGQCSAILGDHSAAEQFRQLARPPVMRDRSRDARTSRNARD